MLIEIWSDVVCPWCYIGKRRFERALSDFQNAHPELDVEIAWRSFELDPNAPQQRTEPMVEHLAKKYGMSVARAREIQAQVSDAAGEEGLSFDLDAAKSGNTFNAHRLIHLAQNKGLGDAMKERFLEAYFTEGKPIGDPDMLIALAEEVGLSRGEAERALHDEATSRAVRDDEALASELGIRGVPFFVIDRRVGISGAQPPATFLQVLEDALGQSAPLASSTDDDATCTDEGCAVDS
ncbi:DsbA family oxidoreductase [Lujinxingia vulgaris]|uniref:DsbA family oxidoreductase n=1 Tax=Lujinxingia vulgaris TaxID=2600176 RepID=A0A5C6XAK8_9DELT|nr:DsbA family oxidoreductase [Lujinxingia vulgaris]TXD37500.1 DsbA family oxidoreductase [Lujinxingia vulgaris]